MKKMTIRRLCILVMLSTILFVQEELLTFIPNVQLTFLLVVVYGATIGIRDGALILLVHVLLDNLFMSSFNLYCMVPQFLGLFITLCLARLCKNKNEFIQCIIGAAGALIYCWLYVLVNIWFLDVRFMDYFIADIPFEIILVASTVVSLLFLYSPLVKTTNELLYKYERKKEMKQKVVKTNKAPEAIGPYSQAIVLNGLVYTSGQIAIQPETGTIVSNDIEEQTKQVCLNISEILKEAGSNIDNTIKTTVFITNMDDFSKVNAVYAKYFKNNPARSCVEVSKLPKGALIEIDVVAYTDLY